MIILGLLGLVFVIARYFITLPNKSFTLKTTPKEKFGVSQIDNTKVTFSPSCTPSDAVYNTDLGDISDSSGHQNNKFGLYIYAENDYVETAGDLVNSNRGDWGYVLIPINVKDYDGGKWKKVFRQLNAKHLIPILQLWDLSENDETDQLKESAQFLNEMDWPIKNRYISVFNETNDSRFWREKADPAQYAEILDKAIGIFKAANKDFFMLNGAFNASARGGSEFFDEEYFLIKMDEAQPSIFAKLDGWASHSYPQPEFSGNPYNTGRDSIKAYEWELNILKNRFGVENLPVFITETGWAHAEGKDYDRTYLPEEITSNYIVRAFKDVWLKDPRVVAVTPFTVRYEPPFDHFSWIKADDSYYLQFKKVQEMDKVAGKPPYLIKPAVTCDY